MASCNSTDSAAKVTQRSLQRTDLVKRHCINVTAEVGHWCCHVVLPRDVLFCSWWPACWTLKVNPVSGSKGIAFVGCKLRRGAGLCTKQRVLEVLWLSIIDRERSAAFVLCGWGVPNACGG